MRRRRKACNDSGSLARCRANALSRSPSQIESETIHNFHMRIYEAWQPTHLFNLQGGYLVNKPQRDKE